MCLDACEHICITRILRKRTIQGLVWRVKSVGAVMEMANQAVEIIEWQQYCGGEKGIKTFIWQFDFL